MGAATVSAIFAAGQASIAHVGDCRVARIRAGSIEALTTEHSLENDYIKARPSITPEELASLPQNIIVRALGMRDSVEVDTLSVKVETGDVFLLMSDGIWRGFPAKELVSEIAARGTDAAAHLVERGAVGQSDQFSDNLTIVVVQIQ
jgi:protein phosphatase